jgi:hypothetical protein
MPKATQESLLLCMPQESGIPLSAATKMLACMYGPSHTDLLEADFATSATLGISTSCTVQYSGTTVAVRDRGAWVQAPGGGDEGGFRDALCAAYAALNRGRLPRECRGVQGGAA